jgi:DNA-binding beta-propeller fold protein YncE
VYVADREHERIVKFWGEGTFVSELGGPAAIGGAQLSGPDDVAVAPGSGETFVADPGHNRVLAYGAGGTLLAKWGAGGGDGEAGSGAGEFSHPAAVAVAPAGPARGDLYVADEGNDRIVELSPAGAVLAQWGSSGGADGRFHSPTGIAVDGAGEVYVVDSENNRVEVFDPSGRFLEKWGMQGVLAGDFSQPSAVAVDCAGEVYVTDTNNNRVERFDLVSPAPTGCASPGSWPPPLDVPPVVHVSLASNAGILARRTLALNVSCQRRCKVLVTATLSPPGRRAVVPLVATSKPLAATRTGQLRLRVGPGALQALRRTLGRRSAMTAHVRIVAAGPTGRRTTASETYTVSR